LFCKFPQQSIHVRNAPFRQLLSCKHGLNNESFPDEHGKPIVAIHDYGFGSRGAKRRSFRNKRLPVEIAERIEQLLGRLPYGAWIACFAVLHSQLSVHKLYSDVLVVL
jgi:hypothetical protein